MKKYNRHTICENSLFEKYDDYIHSKNNWRIITFQKYQRRIINELESRYIVILNDDAENLYYILDPKKMSNITDTDLNIIFSKYPDFYTDDFIRVFKTKMSKIMQRNFLKKHPNFIEYLI